MHATLPLLRSHGFPAIARRRLETLQVNVGYKCEGPAYEPHQAVRDQTRHAHAPRPTVAAP